ncbi:hypothetical protein ACLB2K_023652 [Fragaria x ananassa]
MDDIGDDDNQLQGKELYMHQFKQDFTPRLNEILSFDDPHRITPVVTEEKLIQVLEKLTTTAIRYGRTYIAEDEPRYTDVGRFLGYSEPYIGQQRCFMQLLRECDRDSPEGRKLYNIEAQATLVGRKVSKYLTQMMVVMNIENKKDMMKKFRDTLQMFPFLVDAFEWPGRNEHFGVVFNRINVLMKHAHKELILQVNNRSEMPAGSLGYTNSLKNLDKKEDLDDFLDDRLEEIEQVISKLESLLSFPILPGPQTLLSINIRSVKWLHWMLRELETEVDKNIRNGVRELMSKYKRHEYFNDAEAFLKRMFSPRDEMWTKLESEVKVGRGCLSRGRIRLQVRGTIIEVIQQNRKSALIQVVGINSRMEAEWYVGKRVSYFYRDNVKNNGSHYRCIWGKVTRPHDDSGILCAEFDSNLFPRNCLYQLRVYMYRARIDEVILFEKFIVLLVFMCMVKSSTETDLAVPQDLCGFV